MTCLLCKAEKLTTWYEEHTDYWIADCLTCRVPMLVRRKHGFIGAAERLRLHAIAGKFGAVKYGPSGYTLRDEQRQIPDHWHVHIIPKLGSG